MHSVILFVRFIYAFEIFRRDFLEPPHFIYCLTNIEYDIDTVTPGADPAPACKFRAGIAHTAIMKLTTILCCAWLIFFGISAAVWALTGFDLLALLTFGSAVAYRALLTLAGVGALWLLFWLIAFRPTHELR